SILFGTSDTDDPDLYEWRALAFDAKVKLNTLVRDACSWVNISDGRGSKTYYKNLQLNEESVQFRNKNNDEWEAKAKEWRRKKASLEKKIEEELEHKEDAYWAEHAAEKAKLVAEREELNAKLALLYNAMEDRVKALNNEINAIPGREEIKGLDGKIGVLIAKNSSLAVYKTKEKRMLQNQIDQVLLAKGDVENRMISARKDIEDRIAKTKAEIQTQIEPIQNRINEIHLELTRTMKA
ncbi:MAG: hypothetical protein K6E30_03545, partial [Lachnospiraceae bacterium]|nr:hypothetical protein [Lachnospiraceae bacterium]